MMAAVAALHGDDADEAFRLEAKAESFGMVGYGRLKFSRALALGRLRQDRDEVQRLVDSVQAGWLSGGTWPEWTALFDALVFLGDWERIEAEAPAWIRPDTYVAPFAVRALGIARRDEALVSDAVARFEAMGLEWHAEETRRMRESIRS
jgi:hypothetical protein